MMLERFGLKHRTSIESFVSPGGGFANDPPVLGPKSPMHRLQSTFKRDKKKMRSLPRIRPEIIINTASVNLIQPRLLGKPTCQRIFLTTTRRTVSLHHHVEEPVPFDIIVREKITYVERVPVQLNCMKIHTQSGRFHYFAFDLESELYSWITDLSPANNPTNFRHVVHVEHDKGNAMLNGLPQGWANELSMLPISLPEITSDHFELKRHFTQRLSDISIISSDFDFESEGEEEMAEILKAERVKTDDTLLRVRNPALRIITDNLSSDQPRVPMTASPCTPALTPDSLPTPSTPLRTPFRESPYRYRDTDAENLTGQVQKIGQWAHAHGGCADIWRAVWQNESSQPIHVAVKVLRVQNRDVEVKEKVLRRLRREVRVWHQLRHKHVVPMFGICEGFGEFPSMVSAWYENGHVMAYLQKLGNVATVQKRLRLLIDVACGLNYLHTFSFPLSTEGCANIVHGDLKGANILVNANGEAALADFGLSAVIAVAGQPSTHTSNGGGSFRWMAPELLMPREGIMVKTRASDIYSFGSVILEILTGHKPYRHLVNDMQVITAIHEGHKPERPTQPSVAPVWDLMERCWNNTPADRPVMSFVLSRLEKYYNEKKRSLLND